MRNERKIILEDDGRNLLKIERFHPSVPTELDRAILAQVSRCRRQGKRRFFIKHFAEYSALAAAVCLCCLAPFYFTGPKSMEGFTTPRTSAQWDWKSYSSLDELNTDIERISNQAKSGTSYYGSDLTLDTVIEGINSYEVIL